MIIYQVTDNRGNKHICKTERGIAIVDGEEKETSVIIEADKHLEKFVGESIMRLITVCAMKNYSFEKL